MSERPLPGLGLRGFYAPGQRDWGTSLSEDLRTLSVLVQARAASRSVALPASGSTGDVHVVPADAPDHANALALWDGPPGDEDWLFLTPQEGWQVWIADEARSLRYSNGAWHPAPRPGVVPLRTLTGTAHLITPPDTGAILETTGTDPVTLTLPPDATPFETGIFETSVFETGALIHITQVGTGTATLAADPAVTLNGIPGGTVALEGQWAGAALTRRGPDAWTIQGGLAGPVT